jgi:hypothetical protein
MKMPTTRTRTTTRTTTKQSLEPVELRSRLKTILNIISVYISQNIMYESWFVERLQAHPGLAMYVCPALTIKLESQQEGIPFNDVIGYLTAEENLFI